MDTTPYTDRVSRPGPIAPPATIDDGFVIINPRRKYRRRGTGSVSDTKGEGSEDETGSSMSESEEHELGLLDSDAEGEQDAETGLDPRTREGPTSSEKGGVMVSTRGSQAQPDISKDAGERSRQEHVMRNLITNACPHRPVVFLLALHINCRVLREPERHGRQLTCCSTTK